MNRQCMAAVWAALGLVFGLIAETGAKGDEDKEKQAPDYALVFENPKIHTFSITLTPDDWETMWPKELRREEEPAGGGRGPGRGPLRPPGPRRELDFAYVRATVRFGDEVYENVGLRFKGNSSFMGALRDPLRKPYKMDFDEFVEDQEFHGFKKLNFSNAFKDPSMLREKLAYDLFAKAGVPASRACFARIYVTVEGKYENEYAGLYTLVEQAGSDFLTRHFGSKKGLLVKVESHGDLRYRGDDWSAYERDLEIDKGKKKDTAPLMQFIQFLHDSTGEEFAAEIDDRMNVEGFLRLTAVNTLLSNLDSYAGTGHNFYIYHNPTTKKFEFIPWDLNEAFGNFSMQSTPEQLMDLDVYRPYAGDRVLIRRLMEIKKHRERYCAILTDLIEGPFSTATMSAEIDRLHARIADAARADKRKPCSNEDFVRSLTENVGGGRRGDFGPRPRMGGPPGHVAIGLKLFVRTRIESVRRQLAHEGRGHMIFEERGPGGPRRPGLPPRLFPPGPPPVRLPDQP